MLYEVITVSTALALVAVFNLYPVVSSFILSFQTGKGSVYRFNGFGNVIRLAGDTVFLKALGNTFIYFIFQVPVMIVLALSYNFV